LTEEEAAEMEAEMEAELEANPEMVEMASEASVASEEYVEQQVEEDNESRICRFCFMVGRCRFTLSKSVLKTPMVSALEARI
jgi:hypothetical protein